MATLQRDDGSSHAFQVKGGGELKRKVPPSVGIKFSPEVGGDPGGDTSKYSPSILLGGSKFKGKEFSSYVDIRTNRKSYQGEKNEKLGSHTYLGRSFRSEGQGRSTNGRATSHEEGKG